MKLATGLCAMLLMAGVAAGCSRQSEDATGQIVLGFSQIGAESEWRTANTNSVMAAAKEAGITLRFSDG